MGNLSGDIMNAEAIRYAAGNIADVIVEYGLDDSKELREALARMFQVGVQFTYEKVIENTNAPRRTE